MMGGIGQIGQMAGELLGGLLGGAAKGAKESSMEQEPGQEQDLSSMLAQAGADNPAKIAGA